MDKQLFDAAEDPSEIAERLGLEIVEWLEGVLYARDESELYTIGPVRDDSVPPGLWMGVSPAWSFDGSYVGEEFHTPREAAVHAGLTVIEETRPKGEVIALDGFGRKYQVSGTGNGPIARWLGWASKEEMERWSPRHLPGEPTIT